MPCFFPWKRVYLRCKFQKSEWVSLSALVFPGTGSMFATLEKNKWVIEAYTFFGEKNTEKFLFIQKYKRERSYFWGEQLNAAEFFWLLKRIQILQKLCEWLGSHFFWIGLVGKQNTVQVLIPILTPRKGQQLSVLFVGRRVDKNRVILR